MPTEPLTSPPGSTPVDPTLAVAERQLAMLGELAQIAMALSRAQGAAALAAANAVEVILADEFWQPETGRARALAGNRDAADAYQKVSRSLRLTLAMEMTAAETVRDLRAGVVPTRAEAFSGAPLRPDFPRDALELSGPRPTDVRDSDPSPRCEPNGSDTERLVEYDRADRLPRGSFGEAVNVLCADVGAAHDWANWRVGRPPLDYEPLKPRPPGWSECRPPGWYAYQDELAKAEQSTDPPP